MMFVPGILITKDAETSICVLGHCDFAFFHDENFCIKVLFQDFCEINCEGKA